MMPQRELLIYNLATKSLMAGGLSWSLFNVLLLSKNNWLNTDWTVVGPVAGATGLFTYFLLSDRLTVSKDQLELSKAVWLYRTEAIPLLKIFNGTGTLFRIVCTVTGLATILLSLTSSVYVLNSNTISGSLIHPSEFIFLEQFLRFISQDIFILAIIAVTMMCFGADHLMVGKLLRQWQQLSETSTDEHLVLESLDKITTTKLYKRQLTCAADYSRRLLSVAENMNCNQRN